MEINLYVRNSGIMTYKALDTITYVCNTVITYNWNGAITYGKYENYGNPS